MAGRADVGSYQQLREGGRGVQIVNTIIETARQCNLDKDVDLPDDDSSTLDLEGRDALVGAVYRQLMEIERRKRSAHHRQTSNC